METSKEIELDIEESSKLWHLFQDRFMDSFKFKTGGGWLIRCVKEFVKEYPEIAIIKCDDLMATSSIMVLIPHTSRTSNKVEIITIVTIPQHVGDPSVISLYDPDTLIKMLKKTKEPQMEKRKCELEDCPLYFIPHPGGYKQRYCSDSHKVKACKLRKDGGL